MRFEKLGRRLAIAAAALAAAVGGGGGRLDRVAGGRGAGSPAASAEGNLLSRP